MKSANKQTNKKHNRNLFFFLFCIKMETNSLLCILKGFRQPLPLSLGTGGEVSALGQGVPMFSADVFEHILLVPASGRAHANIVVISL